MQPNLSVIICTHNPRLDYLKRVFQAIEAQTLSNHLWELLLIDNASEHSLSNEINISWHPNARHIREEQLGLTPARLRGIRESQTDILIFVDDDNVLDSEYLETALAISRNYAFIGVWGGRILPSFEEPAPAWSEPYWPMLAIREFDEDRWSNLPYHDGASPCGAGLCVRKIVAEKYAELVNTNPLRFGMDRKGKQLTSSGDSDLAFSACDLGLGKGLFTSLKLLHLIPPNRLQEEYLLKLREELSFSEVILKAFRGHFPSNPSTAQKIFENYCRLRMDIRSRRFYDADKKGIQRAIKEIRTWKKD